MDIYFDYNATHPPIPQILEKNLQLYLKQFGNPSGISRFSQKSLARLEQNRKSISMSLQKFSGESLPYDAFNFTASGTEALYQLVYSFAQEEDWAVISQYEHPAFYAACEDRRLNVKLLDADKSGLINAENLKNKIEELLSENITPAFVSVIGASNETGVIQNAEEISSICRNYGIPFISDMIQAAGKIPFDTSFYDGFTLNGIKFGAGPGASSVFIRPPRAAKPLFRGGSQEDGRRAGTENILAISNFADALEYQIENMDEKNKRLLIIQEKIETFLERECRAEIVGKNSKRIPGTTFAILPPCDMDIILISLDHNQIYISTGSSCKSKSRNPAKSLLAMGYSEDEALRAVRISAGIYSTEQEADIFIEKMRAGFARASGSA